jgi:hypothetical protein
VSEERPIDGLLSRLERTEEERERDLRVAQRRELLDHIDYLIRPPARFYEELEAAIELAAAGRFDEEIEIGREFCTVAEVIRRWELEHLVQRAKDQTWGEAAPESW